MGAHSVFPSGDGSGPGHYCRGPLSLTPTVLGAIYSYDGLRNGSMVGKRDLLCGRDSGSLFGSYAIRFPYQRGSALVGGV